jgi:O-antigen/teichoic acid export membrane protein
VRAEVSASVAGNSLRVLVAQIAGNAGYFASVLVLARALEPAGRGMVAFVTVAALLTSRVAVLGSGEAGKVLAARRPFVRARVLANLVVLTVATSVAGAAIVLAVLALIPGARPAGIGRLELALLGAGIVAVASNTAAASFLQGCSRFREYTRVTAVAPWLYALLLVLLWSGGRLTVPRALAAWLFAQGAPTVLLWLACFREAGFARPDRRLLRIAVRFGLRAWAGGLAYVLNARVDQIVLGLLAGNATLGVYAVAVNGSELLFYVPSAVGSALLPAIALSAPDALAERTLRVFRAVALITLVGAGAAALLGPLLIPLVFGAPYRASVVPFLLLLPSAIGFAGNAVFSSALLAASAPGLSSLGPLVSLPTGIVLDLLLIPPLGASGAALAASAALLCGGTTAACAFGLRRGLAPASLIPRRADFLTLSGQVRNRLSARWTGARWS